MKHKFILFALVWAQLSALAAPFTNLGFDDAITNLTANFGEGGGYGPTEDMLPGWGLFQGNNTVPTVGLNLITAGLGFASLRDSNPHFNFFYSAQGRFSLDLVPSYDPLTLIQVGDVPDDAQSIHFISYAYPVELEINQSLLPLFRSAGPYDPRIHPLFQATNVMADISAFAGQTVELKFIAITEFAQNPHHGLDSIYFSSEAIPEPSPLALMPLGLLIFSLARAYRRGTKSGASLKIQK